MFVSRVGGKLCVANRRSVRTTSDLTITLCTRCPPHIEADGSSRRSNGPQPNGVTNYADQ